MSGPNCAPYRVMGEVYQRAPLAAMTAREVHARDIGLATGANPSDVQESSRSTTDSVVSKW